jgi:hypothetical protein
MPSPAAAFYSAQDTALRGSAGLVAAMGVAGKGILTEAPTNQALPYVLFGQNQVLIEQNEGWAVDVWELQQERYVTDPDQSTHGIAEFHYLLSERSA